MSENQQTEIAHENIRLNKLKLRNESLLAELILLKEENADLKEENADLKEELKEVNSQLNNSTDLISNLQLEATILREENTKLLKYKQERPVKESIKSSDNSDDENPNIQSDLDESDEQMIEKEQLNKVANFLDKNIKIFRKDYSLYENYYISGVRKGYFPAINLIDFFLKEEIDLYIKLILIKHAKNLKIIIKKLTYLNNQLCEGYGELINNATYYIENCNNLKY